PDAETQKLGAILTDFPNLTVIDLSVILAQLKQAIVQVSEAVQFVFLFTLGAGILVLQGALASAFGERHQTLAIMRALGASRSQLRASLTGELLAIGGLAGLLSAVGALVAGKMLAWRLFDLSLVLPYWLLPVAVFGGGVLTVAVAYPGLNRLLSRRPLDALRTI
ncbi:MAG: FtsX-like permease family protein, partial [Azovibrio sp.]